MIPKFSTSGFNFSFQVISVDLIRVWYMLCLLNNYSDVRNTHGKLKRKNVQKYLRDFTE